MVEEAPALEIRVEEAPPGATPFIPELDGKPVEFILEPEEPKVPGFTPYYPPIVPWKTIPLALPTARSLIVDIETTGIAPWDSRIIVISYLDPNDPELEAKTLYSEDEEAMVEAFIQTLQDMNVVEVIGYNFAFDYRMIFAKCMRYQISAAILDDLEIYDMMEIMEKGRRRFMYGRNKAGRLEDWTLFLFGEEKLLTIPDMLRLWGQGKVDEIAAYNRDDVRKIYKLWALDQLVRRGAEFTPPQTSTPDSSGSSAAPEPTTTHLDSNGVITGSPKWVGGWKRVVSKNSFAEQWIPREDTKYRDYITGIVEDTD